MGILLRHLERGEKLVRIWSKARSAKGGAVVAAAADQRDVDPEFFLGPLHKGVVEIAGRIGKGGEHEDLLVWLAELVRGGLGNFGGDELFQFLQFRVGLRA